MSAPLRYARILNALSFRISRRSAISLRMRAIARLSKPETFHLDPVVEHARAARGQRAGNRRPGVWPTVAEQASAPSGTADLGGLRAGDGRARDQIVDRWRGHAGREAFPILPFCRDLAADLVPVVGLQRVPHRRSGVPDAFEA